MKHLLSVVAIALLSASAAQALEARTVRQLNALAPDERREQRCDIEAMNRIRKQDGFQPDKVIAYTFSDPVENNNEIKAKGAVFRSKGNWYRLKFKCRTGEKGLEILSFDYKIGARIPRDQWEEFYLYD